VTEKKENIERNIDRKIIDRKGKNTCIDRWIDR